MSITISDKPYSERIKAISKQIGVVLRNKLSATDRVILSHGKVVALTTYGKRTASE